MFGCGAECPVELWRQITRMGLFTPKDKKLFSLTALLHFVPQRVAVGASAPTTAERAPKSKQNKTQNPIKMLCIACSAARKLCFPFHLHKASEFSCRGADAISPPLPKRVPDRAPVSKSQRNTVFLQFQGTWV